MVYVTHDQTEAMTMGDKIVVMKDGVVNQIDTPLNLYNYPVNKFVAGFIGSPAMNFMSGTITGGQKIAFVSSGKSVTIPFPENSTLKAHTGKVVSLGIRPEDIYDESTKPDSENLVKIHTRLEVVEPMGNEIFLYFVLEGEQHTARVGARESVTAGSDINLYFDTEKLHFFDNETGKRIEI